MDGYGLLAVYKSDWIRFGGKFKENCYFNTVTAEPSDIHLNIFFGSDFKNERTAESQNLHFELPDDKEYFIHDFM